MPYLGPVVVFQVINNIGIFCLRMVEEKSSSTLYGQAFPEKTRKIIVFRVLMVVGIWYVIKTGLTDYLFIIAKPVSTYRADTWGNEVEDVEERVQGSRFKVQGFKVQGSRFKEAYPRPLPKGREERVQGFKVQGSRFKVQGSLPPTPPKGKGGKGSGFWFLVSGFWFLVSGFKFIIVR